MNQAHGWRGHRLGSPTTWTHQDTGNWKYDEVADKFWALDNGRAAWATVGIQESSNYNPFLGQLSAQIIPADIMTRLKQVTCDEFRQVAEQGYLYRRRAWTERYGRAQAYEEAWQRLLVLRNTGRLP